MIRPRRARCLALILVALLWPTDRLEGQEPGDCKALLAESPEEQEAFQCLYERGLEDGVSQAIAELQILADAHPDLGWPVFYLASLHWSDASLAEQYLAQAIDRFQRVEDVNGEALARGNRQLMLFQLGRLEEAGAEAERAAELGEASGDPELFVRGQIVLARHLLTISSDLNRAYRILKAVNDRLPPDSPYSIRRNAVANLARVTMEIGRHREAQQAFEQLLALSLEADDPFSEASAWYGLTRILVDELIEAATPGARSRALETATNALRAARAAGHTDIEGKAHWMLGVLSPPEEGRRHFDRCREVALTPRDRGYCLNGLARRLTASEPLAARRLIEEALALAEGAGDPYSQAFAWSERMRVAWAVEPVDRAVVDSWAALDRIETLRDLQEDGSPVQAGLFSTWTNDYHWFSGRLLAEAQKTARADLVAEAFGVSERLRARALTDWLYATGQGSASARPGFASLREVQRALGPREALLAFQVAPWEDLAGDFGGGSWVIAVTRRAVRAYPLPGRREIRQAVDLYTGLFEQRDGSEAAPSAHLFRQLLALALEELPNGVDRLILVPDDALHRLPFGALRPAPEAPPLAATHRISVAPSASLWLGWRRGAPEAKLAGHADLSGAAALVLAAPVVDGSVSGGRGSGASVAAGLPPLVHARREGHAIAAVLGRRTELARGAAASEALLAGADLSRFGILHLAAHAVTDEAHPERSAVILAPGDVEAETRSGPSAGGRPEAGPAAEDGSETGPATAGSTQDGLLRAGEIAALDLHGKLVVLSSCRSASGTVLRGEGVMSLGRAFFQAGARTVVASLWPVRDDEAAALFEDFYRHLARGETVAAALQAAQSDRIAAGAPASAWAAFIVLGDGDLTPVAGPVVPARDLRLAFAGAAVALLALLAAGGWLARHRVAALLASRRSGRHRPSDLATAPSSTR